MILSIAMKFLKTIFLGLLIFGILSSVTYALLRWYEKAWLPIGIADAKLAMVTGDSWAITSDNHFYFQNERGKKKGWEGYPLDNNENTLIWGITEYGEAVISTSKGIHLKTHSLPAPPFYPTAVGGTYYCEEDFSFTSTIFAITSNQLALYDYGNKSWQILKLSYPVTSQVVLPSLCQLFFVEEGKLHYINLIFENVYNNEKTDVSEHSYDFTEYGGITAITTSGRNIWALTESGEILDIETDFRAEKFITWKKLPSPPELKNPILISGFAGPSFGGFDPNKLDLWIKNDHEIYWYNQELGTWDIFTFPYGQLTSISSITKSSEPFGYTVTRLAIANGRVYRQYPVYSKLSTTFPIFILPMVLFVSFMISGTIGIIKRARTNES